MKDEKIFFEAFSRIIEKEFIFSKNLERRPDSNHIYLKPDYIEYNLGETVNHTLRNALNHLKFNGSFSSASLAHQVDGIIIKHPVLETRIIEFDEEQHFTPALNILLNSLSKVAINKFDELYIEILNNLDYLNNHVLKKCRIKSRFTEYPNSYSLFLTNIKNEKESGYINPKNGFDYLGGRISQRAYYDCLRNLAHLSPKNPELKPILRFPKFYFEKRTSKKFKDIGIEKLKELIRLYLKDIYQIELQK